MKKGIICNLFYILSHIENKKTKISQELLLQTNGALYTNIKFKKLPNSIVFIFTNCPIYMSIVQKTTINCLHIF